MDDEEDFEDPVDEAEAPELPSLTAELVGEELDCIEATVVDAAEPLEVEETTASVCCTSLTVWKPVGALTLVVADTVPDEAPALALELSPLMSLMLL